jgi:ribosomal protein S18 acetylase RimI-like enzyme
MPPSPSTTVIRHAVAGDIPSLVQIETACFASDRISRRSFRHLLTKGHTTTLVVEHGAPGRPRSPAGYAIVLFHEYTAVARLYSIAVTPEARGSGLAAKLMEAAEQTAIERGCVSLRLEVAPGNEAALSLYNGRGYRVFGEIEDYYEDHGDALRLEKKLARSGRRAGRKVPYYKQSLDFTCGPAALMMAMRSLSATVRLDRPTEVSLWREATTVFMTSGHGGCSPYGMALAAHRRGFSVDLHVGGASETLFIDSVRSEEKKEVIRLVDRQFKKELRGTDVRIHNRGLTLEELDDALARGAVPVVLISNYRIYGERAPHWVTVVGADDAALYVHDPWVDEEDGRGMAEAMELPIHRREFLGMARYGRTGQRAALLIAKKD